MFPMGGIRAVPLKRDFAVYPVFFWHLAPELYPETSYGERLITSKLEVV